MSKLKYQSGFANEFASEARPGALPKGQNSPQRPPLGLYAEGISGTPFTAPRQENRRTWVYRIRPSAMHGAFRALPPTRLESAPFVLPPTPNRLRWDPLPWPEEETDFVDGLATMAGNGEVSQRVGVGIHLYFATRPMTNRVFSDADGEFLIVPQEGRLLVRTELGPLDAAPGEIVLVPRGIKFAVDPLDGRARGYVCENYGPFFRLPELGPIGSNGLANPRDFLAPVAAYDERDRTVEVVHKFEGRLYAVELDHSPFDVVAWHGSHVPVKYDLANFMTINTVSFDHPDPSIFTVLTSPSGYPGTANVDFVIFPPRWLVAEHSFRPPWFHRNVMSEFMGLIRGEYDAKAEGFLPGGASLHNCLSAHGPDRATWERASRGELEPHYLGGTLAFMFETRLVCRPTRFALETPALQRGYDDCWSGFQKHFKGG